MRPIRRQAGWIGQRDSLRLGDLPAWDDAPFLAGGRGRRAARSSWVSAGAGPWGGEFASPRWELRAQADSGSRAEFLANFRERHWNAGARWDRSSPIPSILGAGLRDDEPSLPWRIDLGYLPSAESRESWSLRAEGRSLHGSSRLWAGALAVSSRHPQRTLPDAWKGRVRWAASFESRPRPWTLGGRLEAGWDSAARARGLATARLQRRIGPFSARTSIRFSRRDTLDRAAGRTGLVWMRGPFRPWIDLGFVPGSPRPALDLGSTLALPGGDVRVAARHSPGRPTSARLSSRLGAQGPLRLRLEVEQAREWSSRLEITWQWKGPGRNLPGP